MAVLGVFLQVLDHQVNGSKITSNKFVPRYFSVFEQVLVQITRIGRNLEFPEELVILKVTQIAAGKSAGWNSKDLLSSPGSATGHAQNMG